MLKPTSLFSISLLFCLIISSYTQERAPDQIIEIFRHGARAPLHDYDPNWDPSDYGALTAVGMRQHYILGKLLASKYPTIFGAAYDPNQIYVLSDTTPRCIQSAQSQLQGIYEGKGPELKTGYPASLAIPPYKDGRVGDIASALTGIEALPNHNIAPIVNIIEEKDTYIFKNNGPECPNGAIWEKENAKSERAEEGLEIFHDTIKKINKKAEGAFKIKKLKELKQFCETMMADLADNRVLPYKIGKDEALVSNIKYAYGFAAYQIWGGQRQQVELYSFGLIDAILKQMEAFKKGEKYYKAVLYSGHDSNVFSVLAAFGVLHTSCVLENYYASLEGKELPFQNCTYPYFASNMVVEFYNATVNESASVKVLYNGQVLRFCNGQEKCPYEDFVVFARNATGNMTLEAYPEKCGLNVAPGNQNNTVPKDDDSNGNQPNQSNQDNQNNQTDQTSQPSRGNQTNQTNEPNELKQDNQNNQTNQTNQSNQDNQPSQNTTQSNTQNNSQNNQNTTPEKSQSEVNVPGPGPQPESSWGKNLTILLLTVLCFILLADRINTRRKMGQAFKNKYRFNNEGDTQMNYTNL